MMADYEFNYYRSKRFNDHYFLTTDHGSFCVLSKKEFDDLSSKNLNDTLLKKLEEREIIINKNNFEECVRLYKKRNNFLFRGTSLHIVVVTLRCNMNCIYCHASSKSDQLSSFDMTQEIAQKTIDFIFQSPNPSITIEFQGGEPLLNWDTIKYIIKYAEEKNHLAKKYLRFSLVTNLSLMDNEKMDFLIEHGVGVCTSLDGPKEIHDHNRKYSKGSNYEQLTHWIKKFQEEYAKKGIKDRQISALVTLTKKSISQPEQIVDEYISQKLESIHLRFLNNLGVAKNAWDTISYTVEEYLLFWKKAMAHLERRKIEGKKIEERMVQIMFKKIGTDIEPNYLDLRSPCGAAIGQLAYDFNGDIYTCDEARMIGEDTFLLGNVRDSTYKETVTSKTACTVVNASINDQYVCDDCVYKPYCGVCPVCNYSEQGNLIGKISMTDRCKIFKTQFDWVVKEKFIKKNNDV